MILGAMLWDHHAQSNDFQRSGPNVHVWMRRNMMAPHHVEKKFSVENVQGQRSAKSEEPPEGKLDTCGHRVEVVKGIRTNDTVVHDTSPRIHLEAVLYGVCSGSTWVLY